MDELLGLIISTVISFVISMIVWKFIYHKKLAESEADCSGVLEDQLKLQLRELFNSPALFLRDKEVFEKCAETWFPDDSKKEKNK